MNPPYSHNTTRSGPMNGSISRGSQMKILDEVIESLKSTILKFSLLAPISHPSLHEARLKKLNRVLEELNNRKEWIR